MSRNFRKGKTVIRSMDAKPGRIVNVTGDRLMVRWNGDNEVTLVDPKEVTMIGEGLSFKEFRKLFESGFKKGDRVKVNNKADDNHNEVGKVFNVSAKTPGFTMVKLDNGELLTFENESLMAEGKKTSAADSIKAHDIRTKNQKNRVKDKKIVDKHKFAHAKP